MNDSSTMPTAAGAGLKQQTLSGAAWISGGQVAQIITRLGVMMILARLLTPADFGLVAFAVVILGFCQTVAPLGTASALVRLQAAGPPEIKAAFTISMLMATLLAAGAITAGYAVERRMNQPGLGLATLLLAPAIYFEPVKRIADRMLQTRMRFRPTVVAALLGYLSGYGGVGVTLAYQGFGWRALCCAEVTYIAVSASYLVWTARPPFALSFNIPIWRNLVGFGAPLTAANLIGWCSINLPRLMLGTLAGATALGLYARGADLSMRFGSLADRLCGNVLFAAFCQRSDDKPKLAQALSAAMSLILLVVLPGSAMLSALAEPIVLLLFGNQWTGAVGAFQVLAFLTPLLLVRQISLAISNSLGRTGFGIRTYTLALVISFIGSIFGARYGPEGVALAVILAFGVSSILAFLLVSRELGMPLSAFGASIIKGSVLASSVFTFCVMSKDILNALFGPFDPISQLAIIIPMCCTILMLAWSFGQRWLFSEPAQALILEVRGRVGRRFGENAPHRRTRRGPHG